MFKQVELTFEGRTFQIDVRTFDHLINCGLNALYADKAELEAKPFDWDSPTVEIEFRNRHESLNFTKGCLDETGHLSDWLNKRGRYEQNTPPDGDGEAE